MNTVHPLKTRSEIDAMKGALHGRDQLLFIVGINTALRVSDLLALTVGQVRGRETLTITERKTGKRKRFRLNSAVKAAVKELVPAGAVDDQPLFPSRKGGRPLGRVQAYNVLRAAADRAGVTTEVGCHSMRKTFAYFAYQGGTDLALLMRILNHGSQRETLRYIGQEQSDIDEVYVCNAL